MWYGLLRDGEIVDVKFFNHIPTIMDFNYPLSGVATFSIAAVEIIIKGC